MKHFIYFVSLILFFINVDMLGLVNEDCSMLQGDYQLSTGEKWRLKVIKQSPERYFVFYCDENDCNKDIDQITFRYQDCDARNDFVMLCPEDGSLNADVTFSLCTADVCSNITGNHFTKIEFHRRGKPTWTGKYLCANN